MVTGKYFEEILEMLTAFRTQIQVSSALGLLNINKHSENFLKRILNLTYDYELENLNKSKSNYPGLDLGDTGEKIAFQITSTKKTDKIEDALTTCLKYKHYETFKDINVFVLTSKQSSYTIKTVTEPHFSFSPDKNIKDFTDLCKDIEHLPPLKIEALYKYIKFELQPVLESIRDNKTETESYLLDTESGMTESHMPKYAMWRSKIELKTEDISVPKIHTQLSTFLEKRGLKTVFLPILNEALRNLHSHKKIGYLQQLQATHIRNHFYGNAMLLEPSSITIEKANYADGDFLLNLYSEMVSMLTCILFFSKQVHGNFEIEVSISIETNGIVYFHPPNSLVLEHVLNSYTLDSPYTMTETISNTHTSTLVDLLQEIMHGFISHEPSHLTTNPFITIKRELTEFVINNIKKELDISDYSIL